MNRKIILQKVLDTYKVPLLIELKGNKALRIIWFRELLIRMKSWGVNLEPNVTSPRAYMFDVMNQVNRNLFVDVELMKDFCEKNGLMLTGLDQ